MRLVILDKGETVGEITGERDAIYIGRDEHCQVHLPDERIAPQHAVIYPDGPRWCIQPLVDRRDLLINGEAVHDSRPLADGDELTLFDYKLCAALEGHEQPPEDEPLDTPSPIDDLDEFIGDDENADEPATPETDEDEFDDSQPLTDTHVHRAQMASMTRFARFPLPYGSTVKKIEEPISVQRPHIVYAGQMSVALGGCETPEQVMDIAIRAMFERFSPHRAWIGLRRVNYGPMEYVDGRLLTGQTVDLPELGENLKPRVLDRCQFVLIPRVSDEEPISILAGPLTGPDGTLGMVYLEQTDFRRRFTQEHMDEFVLLLAAIGAQLDAVFKGIAKQRAATVEGEVAVAHAIQQRLNPRKLPQWEELQFGAFREPGRERSSDLYDVVRLSNNLAAFMLSHTVAGGSLACQHMAQAQAAFRVALMHMDAPHVYLKSLNALLYDGEKGHDLHSIMGAIDPATGKMHFALAGNIRAYIIGARGEERRLTPEDPQPPIGAARSVDYTNISAVIDEGETLVLFTPGVVTARNSKQEVFGEERFVNILCDGFGQLASSMLKEMLSDLQTFTEGGTQPDDITVILAHRV